MTATEMNNLLRLRLDEVSSLGTKSYEDEEISDFLTQAQLRLVKRYASAYEKNEYARKVLSKIVTGPTAVEYVNDQSEDKGEPINLNSLAVDNTASRITPTSLLFKLPENVMRVVYEEVVVDGTYIDVYPITHDEYIKTKRNKYKQANSRKALRLESQAYNINIDTAVSTKSLGHELICPVFSGVASENISYKIKYIQNPENIIYSQVPSEIRDCYLADFVHDEIIDEAVLIALEISKEQRLQTFAQIKQGNNG